MRGDFLCLSAEASNTTLYTIFHIEQLLLYPRFPKKQQTIEKALPVALKKAFPCFAVGLVFHQRERHLLAVDIHVPRIALRRLPSSTRTAQARPPRTQPASSAAPARPSARVDKS